MKLTFTGDLPQNLKKLSNQIQDKLDRSAARVGLAIIDDAVNEAPTPPIDTGFLRGSAVAYANGEKIHFDPGGKKASWSNQPPTIPTPKGKIQIQIIFDTPYAAHMHEDISPGKIGKGKLQDTGDDGSKPDTIPVGQKVGLGPKSRQAGNVGPKFLQQKLDVNRNKYSQMFARALAQELQK